MTEFVNDSLRPEFELVRKSRGPRAPGHSGPNKKRKPPVNASRAWVSKAPPEPPIIRDNDIAEPESTEASSHSEGATGAFGRFLQLSRKLKLRLWSRKQRVSERAESTNAADLQDLEKGTPQRAKSTDISPVVDISEAKPPSKSSLREREVLSQDDADNTAGQGASQVSQMPSEQPAKISAKNSLEISAAPKEESMKEDRPGRETDARIFDIEGDENPNTIAQEHAVAGKEDMTIPPAAKVESVKAAEPGRETDPRIFDTGEDSKEGNPGIAQEVPPAPDKKQKLNELLIKGYLVPNKPGDAPPLQLRRTLECVVPILSATPLHEPTFLCRN